VVCSPVNTMIMKSGPFWADARLSTGFSAPLSRHADLSPLSTLLGGVTAWPGGAQQSPSPFDVQSYGEVARLRDLCQVQRFQNEQGRSVFIEDMTPNAPATAHVDAAKRGELGPFPWRRPV
jgi:hypothetical protein